LRESKAVIKAKGGYFEESHKIYWFNAFYFGYMIPYLLFHSLFPQIFYNVENSKNKETLELVSVNF
jgi:hypothetical protein